VTKAIHAEKAGARMLIIADNDPLNENMIDMIDDGTNRESNIPSAFIQWKDGLVFIFVFCCCCDSRAIIHLHD
jgi:hypothetical protein